MAYIRKDIDRGGITTYTGADGNTYTMNLKGTDGYKTNNWPRAGKMKHVDGAIQYFLEYGVYPTKAEFEEYTGYSIGDNAWQNVNEDVHYFASVNNIDVDAYGANFSETTAKEDAYNDYYNDLYSLQEGTLGKDLLNQYTEAEYNAADSNMQLAEAQYQQAAMQQAEVVKSITDQVKAERMARLRAGMSESQIANQDMQIMLNNMNTLNQQMNTMDQNRFAAQQQRNLAQDTAYQQYINSATGIGQTSAAFAASDAGDAYMQTLKRMKATGENYKTSNKHVTGQTT